MTFPSQALDLPMSQGSSIEPGSPSGSRGATLKRLGTLEDTTGLKRFSKHDDFTNVMLDDVG